MLEPYAVEDGGVGSRRGWRLCRGFLEISSQRKGAAERGARGFGWGGVGDDGHSSSLSSSGTALKWNK